MIAAFYFWLAEWKKKKKLVKKSEYGGNKDKHWPLSQYIRPVAWRKLKRNKSKEITFKESLQRTLGFLRQAQLRFLQHYL